MTIQKQLLIFTRYPEAGTTKTRLIPSLGPEGAARLQHQLTLQTVAAATPLAKQYGVHIAVHYSGGTEAKMQEWLGPLTFICQPDGDLGCRMAAAFTHAFSQGMTNVVLVGSDIPGLTLPILSQAFAILDDDKVALGPSLDGGYYLIGLNNKHASQLIPLLLSDMIWSTARVLSITVARLKKAGFPMELLPQLRDIDHPADLKAAQQHMLI